MEVYQIPNEEKLNIKELENEDPSKYIAGLLEGTKTRIQFSTALSNFYKSPDIQQCFEKIARKKSISVDLLLDADIDLESKKKELAPIFNAFKDTEKLTVKQSKEKIPHWLIIDDGNHIRIEKEHNNRDNVIRTSNAILYHTSSEKDEVIDFLVKNIKNQFTEWWKKADSK